MRITNSFDLKEVFIPGGAQLELDLGSFEPALSANNARVKYDLGFTTGDCYGESKRSLAVLDAQAQKALCPPDSIRAKLYALQESIACLPDIEFPLQHTFAPGIYARTIQLPAGSVILGKIHRHRHVNILSQGTVQVLTEAGGLQTLTGPLTMVSEPGTKRAVYAETDAVWTTIHPTDTDDLTLIEAEVISPTYAAYEQFKLENPQ